MLQNSSNSLSEAMPPMLQVNIYELEVYLHIFVYYFDLFSNLWNDDILPLILFSPRYDLVTLANASIA